MLSLGRGVSIWEHPPNYLKKIHIYSEVRKFGQRQLISGAVLNYVSYLSPRRQNLPPESWKHVGFAILFLIQDSGWAIPMWEAGHTLQGGTAVSLKLHCSSEEFSLWVMRRGTALNSLATADSEQNPVRSCRESSTGLGWSKDQTKGLSLAGDGLLLIHAQDWKW